MIFDPNGAYRYADGEYPTSSQGSKVLTESARDMMPAPVHDDLEEDFEVPSEYFDPNPNVEHEERPNPFLLEPEMSNALDPRLFLSTPSLHRESLYYPRFE